MERKLSSGDVKKCKLPTHTPTYIPPALYGRHMVTVLPGQEIGSEMIQHIRDVVTKKSEEHVKDTMATVKKQGCCIKGNVDMLDDFEKVLINSPTEDIQKDLELFANLNGNKYCNNNCKYSHLDIVAIKRDTAGNPMARQEIVLETITCRKGKSKRQSMPKHENVPEVVASRKHKSKRLLRREKIPDVGGCLKTKRKYLSMRLETVPELEEDTNAKGDSIVKNDLLADMAASMKGCTICSSEQELGSKINEDPKANIKCKSDGQLPNTSKKVVTMQPKLKLNDSLTDNYMQMAAHPEYYDVLVRPNLYGTILCNIICGLLGGAGLIFGSNFEDNYAAFEACSRITGTPIPEKHFVTRKQLLDAAVNLLYYLSIEPQGFLLEHAVNKTTEDATTPEDIAGRASTSGVVSHIQNSTESQLN